MQATQSSKASGMLGRSEQFAALRFISRQMAMDADVERDVGAGSGGPPGHIAGGVKAAADIAHDAASLLAVMSLYSELLARPGLSRDEHAEYASQLKLLADQSWELVGRFLRRSRRKMDSVTATSSAPHESSGQSLAWVELELPPRRGPMRETCARQVIQGAAGWMAC